MSGKRIYFASDLHLGAPGKVDSAERERLFVRWLDEIEPDLEALYLLGDIFDMWFEYKKAVPKGYVRLLGRLAKLADQGIPIHYFTGNHDMWVFDHLPKEIGMHLHRDPIRTELKGKRFLIGHGDGLGPGDKNYKRLKRIFRDRTCQWLFRWVHPDLGLRVAEYFSSLGREGDAPEYLGADREWLLQYCKEVLQEERIDRFVFGHRHIPLDIPLEEGEDPPRYINLGDWIRHFSYAVLDEEKMELRQFSP